jgi:hypothetical protein
MIDKAFRVMDTENKLWEPFQSPEILWNTSSLPNGFARMTNTNTPQIITTLGVYHRVHDFAYRLFSISDLVTGIGDAEAEGGSLAARVADRAWIKDPGEPRCPVRRNACFLTAESAISLVFYHEAGHIILGHLTAPGAPKSYQERVKRSWISRWKRPTTTATRKFQIQELQADRLALAVAMHHIRTQNGVFPGQIVDSQLIQHLPDIMIIAQVALHLVLADTTMSVADFDQEEHPHPMTRFIDALGSLTRGKMLRANDNLSGVTDAFRLAALMRRQRITEVILEQLKKDALSQHEAIAAAASTVSVPVPESLP